MVDTLSYFSSQPVLHDLCNKSHGVCYPVCGRASARGAIGRRNDPLWWINGAISRSTQYSTTGLSKAVVCVILSVGWSSASINKHFPFLPGMLKVLV